LVAVRGRHVQQRPAGFVIRENPDKPCPGVGASDDDRRDAMDFALQPVTEPGKAYVALPESHVDDLARWAVAHARAAPFVAESIAALTASGLLAANVPRELGGLGNPSIHDQVVALGRLGRGDGAVAIAANMHATFAFFFARDWAAARAAGNTQ